MSNLLYEGPGRLYMNGQLLAEVESMTVRVQSGNQKVYTMHRGMAGRSRGPRETQITWETAVPIAGHELDFYDAIDEDKDFRAEWSDGGRLRASDGWIDSGEATRASQAAANSSLTFEGGPVRSL